MYPIAGRRLDVLKGASVEEGALFGAVVSESVPLRTALGIESQDIVIDRARSLILDSVLESRPTEARGRHTIERPIC